MSSASITRTLAFPGARALGRGSDTDQGQADANVDALGSGLGWLLDVFVVTAILIVVAAIGIGLVHEAGLPPTFAVTLALALTGTLVCVHVMVRRAGLIGELRQAMARVDADLSQLAEPPLSQPPAKPAHSQPQAPASAANRAQAEPSVTRPPAAKPASQPATQAAQQSAAQAASQSVGAEPADIRRQPVAPRTQKHETPPQRSAIDRPGSDWMPTFDQFGAEQSGMRRAGPDADAPRPHHAPERGHERSVDRGYDRQVERQVDRHADRHAERPVERTLPSAEPASQGDFDLRPGANAEPRFAARPAAEAAATAEPYRHFEPAPISAASDSFAQHVALQSGKAHSVAAVAERPKTESSLIKDVLERMALDMGLPRQQERVAIGALGEGGYPVARPAPRLPDPVPAPSPAKEAQPSSVVPEPVARAAELEPEAKTEPNSAAPQQPQPDAQMKLAAIASALAQERVDVFLEPIKSLEDNAPRHFEIAVRLRLDADGEAVERKAYSKAAAGTPLLPLIDAVTIAKTRRVVWRLMEHDVSGNVFSTLDGGSLVNEQFMEDFNALMRGERGAAGRIVLSFPQSDVRHFTRGQFTSLSRMTSLGFSFAVDHLVDLETDFETLGRIGFSFVKIDADVFLEGLPVGQLRIPADDICRHLKSAGLTPIVGHIRDKAQLQRLRACGVALGQGPMLGAARAVRADWLAAK